VLIESRQPRHQEDVDQGLAPAPALLTTPRAAPDARSISPAIGFRARRAPATASSWDVEQGRLAQRPSLMTQFAMPDDAPTP